MASERAGFLTQMVEVFTSTVSIGERLNNMVHLLARYLKVDMALYFGLDKAKETLVLNISSQGPVAPHLRLEFPLGTGLVGETAATRKQRTAQLLEMLGLWPLPEKTPLKPVVTGSLEFGDVVIDKLHFQSRPGRLPFHGE